MDKNLQSVAQGTIRLESQITPEEFNPETEYIVNATVISGEPYVNGVYLDDRFQLLNIKLDVTSSSIETKRINTMNLLYQHNRYDVLGVCTGNFNINGGALECEFRLASSSGEQMNFTRDIVTGIRKNVSVGGTVLDFEYDEQYDIMISGETIRGVRITRFEPQEVSVVSVPADPSAVLRAFRSGLEQQTQPAKKVTTMPTSKDSDNKVENQVNAQALLDYANQANVTLEQAKEAMESALRHNSNEAGRKVINEAMEANLKEREDAIVKKGEALAKREKDLEAGKNTDPDPDLKATVIDSQVAEKNNLFLSATPSQYLKHLVAENDSELDPQVAEIQSIAKDKGYLAGRKGKGVFIPFAALAKSRAVREMIQKPHIMKAFESAVSTTSATGLIDEDLASAFYRMAIQGSGILDSVGARFVPMMNDTKIGVQTGGLTIEMIASDGTTHSLTDSTLPSGTVEADFTTFGARLQLTRKVVKQSNPSATNLAVQDAMVRVFTERDKLAFTGTGASGQPSGIFTNTNVNSQTIAATNAPTYKELTLSLAETMENAKQFGAINNEMCFIVPPATWSHVASTSRTGEGDTMIARESSMMRGMYKTWDVQGFSLLIWTELTAAQQGLVGNFDEMYVGTFTEGITIHIDEHLQHGGQELLMFHDSVPVIRTPEAFTKLVV